MSAIDCHYGDHRYRGARCADCGQLNGGLLAWQQVERAMREGRHHGDHWHRSLAKAKACKRAEEERA